MSTSTEYPATAEPKPGRRRRRQRVIAGILALVALPLALPHLGPITLLVRALTKKSVVSTIQDPFDGGSFDLVSTTYFPSHNEVIIVHHREASSGAGDEIVHLTSPDEVQAHTVSLTPTVAGLQIDFRFDGRSGLLVVPREELILLRWLGPRIVVDGQPRALWHWSDALDSVLLLLVAGLLQLRDSKAGTSPKI